MSALASLALLRPRRSRVETPTDRRRHLGRAFVRAHIPRASPSRDDRAHRARAARDGFRGCGPRRAHGSSPVPRRASRLSRPANTNITLAATPTTSVAGAGASARPSSARPLARGPRHAPQRRREPLGSFQLVRRRRRGRRPVLADPTGADQGGERHPARRPRRGRRVVPEPLHGPGQRDPLGPVVPRSVRLNASPWKIPARSTADTTRARQPPEGRVPTRPGGAMAHSRLSLQPPARPRAREGNTCADGHVAASSRDVTTACAFASAASPAGVRVRPRARRVGDSRHGRDGRATREPPAETAEPADEDARVDAHQSVDQSADRGADQGAEEDAAAAALAASTRRVSRPSESEANHEAALAAAAAARRCCRRRRRRGAHRSPAARRWPAPLPPSRFPRRDHEAGVPRENAESAVGAPASSDHRVAPPSGRCFVSRAAVVFFGAPDAHPSRVASWISGETPWPEIRVMELSRRERTHLDVPTRAPTDGVERAAETAKEELRVVAREDAERAAIEAVAKCGGVRGGRSDRGRGASSAGEHGDAATGEHHRTVGASDARRGPRRAGPGPGPRGHERRGVRDVARETPRDDRVRRRSRGDRAG